MADENKCVVCGLPATDEYREAYTCGELWCHDAVDNAHASETGGPVATWIGGEKVSKNKSILDGVPAVEVDPVTGERKPLPPGRLPGFAAARRTADHKGIVGNCPTCGAPIYGDRTVAAGQTPAVSYSCTCVNTNTRPKDFGDTVETK